MTRWWRENFQHIKLNHSNSTLSVMLKKFLNGIKSERNVDDSSNCICLKCFDTFDEFDWMRMTAYQKENELRNLLLRTEKCYPDMNVIRVLNPTINSTTERVPIAHRLGQIVSNSVSNSDIVTPNKVRIIDRIQIGEHLLNAELNEEEGNADEEMPLNANFHENKEHEDNEKESILENSIGTEETVMQDHDEFQYTDDSESETECSDDDDYYYAEKSNSTEMSQGQHVAKLLAELEKRPEGRPRLNRAQCGICKDGKMHLKRDLKVNTEKQSMVQYFNFNHIPHAHFLH